MKHQRYSTALKLHYAAGILPDDFCKNILASTRHGWKYLSKTHFFNANNESIFEHENTELTKLLLEIKRLRQQQRLFVYLLLLFKKLLLQFVITKDNFLAIRQYAVVCDDYARHN